MKSLANYLTLAGLVFSVSFVWAMPPDMVVVTNRGGQTLTLPSNAIAVTDTVFDLGSAFDPGTGKLVRGYAILHPKKEFHHQPVHNGGPPGGNGGGGTSNCFAFLANGAKWKTAEPWVMNTSNTEGLGSAFVFDNLAANIAKWEDAADGTVLSGAGVNVLGDGATTNSALSADMSSPDNTNEVYFGDVGSAGAIAVTIVWGIFSGPPSQRQLVEWDMVFDQVDFDWSDSGAAGTMDYENIATHELGHAVGMGHPSDSCTEETMYRFADFGETKKRSLEAGDIAGVSSLY